MQKCNFPYNIQKSDRKSITYNVLQPQSELMSWGQFSHMGVYVISVAMVAEVMAIIGEHGEA